MSKEEKNPKIPKIPAKEANAQNVKIPSFPPTNLEWISFMENDQIKPDRLVIIYAHHSVFTPPYYIVWKDLHGEYQGLPRGTNLHVLAWAYLPHSLYEKK